MTQYSNPNVHLTHSKLEKLKSKTKNCYRSNFKTIIKNIHFKTMIDIANDTNCLCKLFLSQRKILNLFKAFANHSSADKKLSKTYILKIKQSGGFLGGAM